MRILIAVLAISSLAACTQGHCRHKVDSPEMATPPAVAAPAVAKDERVYVYKYDGGLQCGLGKPVVLEVMGKQLQGITIYSQNKKRDGLMHIQVCGSITGMANVYEIPMSQLKKAETLGFKKWSFE